MAIARDAYAAFARGGIEAILEFAHPEIEWHMWEHFAGKPTVFRGHDGVRKVQSIFDDNIDDFWVEPLEFIEVGDHVLVPVRLHGKGKGTDQPVEFELVHVWTARDGKAIRLDAHGTKEEALRFIGAFDASTPG